jgi:hypothetical protein
LLRARRAPWQFLLRAALEDRLCAETARQTTRAAIIGRAQGRGMTTPRYPFPRAGDVIGYIVVALTLGPLIYSILPLVVPWFFYRY